MANELNKGAVVAEINGIKYFKLQSKYPGDYTKNCGLLGNEIDENFYFLRSYDIADINIDENKNIIATRVDGDTITVNMSELLKQYKFYFDKTTGVLTVKFPDGTVEELDGFLVEGKDTKTASDATLRGDGTVLNPLGISELERTGTFKPVDEIIENGAFPTGVKKGYRVVAKEKVNNFGCLYTYDGVRAIMNALEESSSPWRVPSREDWAELLNAAETCEENRNHDTTLVNTWTGKDAGARAKSTTIWANSTKTEEGLPVTGEDNLPYTGSMGTFCVLPVGVVEIDEELITKDELEGYTKFTTYWTSSYVNSCRKDSKIMEDNFVDGEKNVFTRTFAFNTRKVKQESSKPNAKYSLRLVRDFSYLDNKVEGYEKVLGQDMKCVHIANEDASYSKVWTSFNVGLMDEIFSGTSDYAEWSNTGNVRDNYYVAEWDGLTWKRRELAEGESVVIVDGGDGKYNHEWRVYSGETAGQLILKDTLDEQSEETKKLVKEEKERAMAAEATLQANIDSEAATARDAEKILTDNLEAEVTRAKAEEKVLQENIDNEEARAISAETALDKKIDYEISGLTMEEVPANEINLDDDVRVAYKFVDARGNQHGELIKIYKDEKIHSITTDTVSGHTVDSAGTVHRTDVTYPVDVLIIVYRNDQGTYSLTEINLDELFQLNAGDGILFKDGKIHVRIDSGATVDKFLTVGPDGVKLSGVTTNIEEIADAVGLDGDATTGMWAYSPATTHYITGATKVKDAIDIIADKLYALSGTTGDIEKDLAALSAATIESADTLNKKIVELSAATIESANTLSGYIKTLRHDAEVSANTLSGYVWDEECARESGDTNIANLLKISGNTDDGFYVEFSRPLYVPYTGTEAARKLFDHVPQYEEIIENGYWNCKTNQPETQYLYIGDTSVTPTQMYELSAGTNYIITAKTYMDAIVEIDKQLNRVEKGSDALSASVITLSGEVIYEIARAWAAEGSLSGSIDTLRNDTEASANTLQTNITAEENRATAAEQFISAATTVEIARAKAAEDSLSGSINTLRNDTNVSANTLQTNIDNLEWSAKTSAHTLSGLVSTEESRATTEEERLDGQDIDGSSTYNLDSQGNVTLNRKNGTDTITIHFTGNFGQI